MAGLSPTDARQAFRRAAEDALSRLPCVGEGAIQRAYFDPPDDYRASRDISRDCWSSKLVKQPALEHGRDLRRRIKLVG